jgi:hypothetical protein
MKYICVKIHKHNTIVTNIQDIIWNLLVTITKP